MMIDAQICTCKSTTQVYYNADAPFQALPMDQRVLFFKLTVGN
jgi:hypothetical protein